MDTQLSEFQKTHPTCEFVFCGIKLRSCTTSFGQPELWALEILKVQYLTKWKYFLAVLISDGLILVVYVETLKMAFWVVHTTFWVIPTWTKLKIFERGIGITEKTQKTII